jgi:hypothetical protein
MKNTYKWRANSYKYVYIEDAVYSANTENGYVTKGAFLYNKQTGIKIYGRNSDNTLITSTDKVEESLIANVVKGITDGNTYTDLFNRMKSLVDECGDSDYANIKFHEVNEYFNIDGEECAENPPPEPCACYEPVINATAEIEDSGYIGPYIINKGSVTNHTDKVVITNFEFHIPRGKDGAGGNGGEIGPQGPQGPQGKPGDVIDVIDCTYTTGETGECSVNLTDNVYKHPSGYTEHDLTFNFHLIRGEQGPQGDPGDDGNDGYSSKIGNVAASANTINSDESASVTVTDKTTRDDASRQFVTDLDFVFDIPKGETGEQGPQGEPAKISGVTIEVFQLNEDSEDASPEGRAEFREVTVPYLDEEGNTVYTETQYILDLKLYLPKGPKGDKGDIGLPGDKGDTEYYYINESGFTNDDDSGGGNYYGTRYDFNNVYWCTDEYNPQQYSIGRFIETTKSDGTTSVDICLTPKFFNNGEDGGIDLEEGDVYLCGTDKPIGDVKFVKTEDNGNEYKINVCINEEYLRGGLLYCEGSGITFTEGEDNCTTINSNTESYTVSAITCSTGAPIEALGLWDGNVIPSGTTVQAILEKLLCREIFPASATFPTIVLSKGTPTLTRLYEIGEEITLPSIGMTKINGNFNAGSTKRAQPSVTGVKWSNEEIIPRITDGFSTFTPSRGSTSISSASNVEVDLGLNKIVYDGSADYTKPSNMPITNLGNPTQSTSKVSTDDSDISAIWPDGTATNNINTQVIGVYPIFTSMNSTKTGYMNSVLDISDLTSTEIGDGILGVETNNILPLALTDSNVIDIINCPAEIKGGPRFMIDYPERGLTSFQIKTPDGKYTSFTSSYTYSDKVIHIVNNKRIVYNRLIFTSSNYQGAGNTYKLTLNKSLDK